MMTSRQRLQTILQGRPVDRIPLTTWCFGLPAPPHLRWRRDGRLVTERFRCLGGELTLNLDCGGLGEASVEVCTAEGAPFPGFTHADCDRVDLNHLAAFVTWRGRTTRTLPAGGVRMDIRMNSMKLYAWTVARESVEEKSK